MPDILASLPGMAAAGGSAGAMVFALKLLVDFVAGRMNKREAANFANSERLDDATYKLIQKLEERLDSYANRLDRVEGELVECRAQHAQCEMELGRLRAIVQGMGDAKQVAQNIVSAERVMDRAVAKIVNKAAENKE